jgi:hypothetical protein
VLPSFGLLLLMCLLPSGGSIESRDRKMNIAFPSFIANTSGAMLTLYISVREQ